MIDTRDTSPSVESYPGTTTLSSLVIHPSPGLGNIVIVINFFSICYGQWKFGETIQYVKPPLISINELEFTTDIILIIGLCLAWNAHHTPSRLSQPRVKHNINNTTEDSWMLKACKSSQAGKCLKSILCSILLAYPAMKVYPAYIITADNHQADTISRLQTPPEFLTLQITPLTRRSNLIDITYRRKSCYPKSLLHCSCTRYRTSSGQECSDASFKVEIIHRVLSCYAPRFSNIEKLFASRPHYYNGLLCRGIMNVSLSFVSPNLT